jgi:uncharacterized protein
MVETAGPDPDQGERLQILDRDECERLLTQESVGRVAVVLDGRPMIRPVNYRFRDRSIIFQTDRGTKLAGIAESGFAEFEVDSLDVRRRIGWSVIVAGVAEEVTNEGEIAAFEHLGLDVWAVGHRARWIRIRAQMVAGRRIERYGAGP